MKTTVFLFHPNFANSRVNKALAAGLLGDIEVRDMYALYPDFQIDVAKEQAVMEASDRIVLQTPMYWYSGTPLLKKWEDDVLTYGWAYGSDGNALHGKELLVAITPGADNYGAGKFVPYTVHELLRPFQAMSNLIGTKFVTPFVTTGASSISDEALAKRVKEYADYLSQDELKALGAFE